MKKHLLLLFIIITALKGMGQQSGTAQINHNVSLTLVNAIEITITRGQNVSINFNNSDNYQNGVTTNNVATLRVRSSASYNVTVKSASTHFVSNSATNMPVSGILSVRVFPQGQFMGISTVDAILLSNQTKGISNFNLSYRANPGFNYEAGTYTANIIYTATQQ